MRSGNKFNTVRKDDVDWFVLAIDDSLLPVDPVPVRPLRAPASLPSKPVLKQIQILHRPPQTTWIKDDSRKANSLLDGLSSYLRSKDPLGSTK